MNLRIFRKNEQIMKIKLQPTNFWKYEATKTLYFLILLVEEILFSWKFFFALKINSLSVEITWTTPLTKLYREKFLWIFYEFLSKYVHI